MQIKLKYGIYVNKSPNVVFAYLANPDNMLQWQSSMFMITGKTNATAQGTLQLGTAVQDRRKVLGKPIDAQWQVVDFVQDKRLGLRVQQGNVTWETTYTLEPLDAGTHLAVDGGGDLGQVSVPDSAAHRSCENMFVQDLTTFADILQP